jgi:uncharacterized glyoxalase superfamily protein PhnB
VNTTEKPTASCLVPVLRYGDVVAAADWLCAAFGFEKSSIVTGDQPGTVRYALLTFGPTMIMLAPSRDVAPANVPWQSDDGDRSEMQSCYFVVGDADAHYARAKAAGAVIVFDIEDFDHGGRGYSCRDPQGHVWNFGTHNPWGDRAPKTDVSRETERMPRGRKRWALASGVLATIIATAVAAAWINGGDDDPRLAAANQAVRQAEEQLILEKHARLDAARAAEEAKTRFALQQGAKEAADRSVAYSREELAREREAKVKAQHAADEARKRIAEVEGAKDAAERTARELEQKLTEEKRARETAEQITAFAGKASDAEPQAAPHSGEAAAALQKMQQDIERERAANDAAHRMAAELGDRLTQEHGAREAAERAAQDMRDQLAKEQASKEAAERAMADAQKQASLEQGAREAAERAGQEAREQLDRERAAKDQAWKMVSQLRKRLGGSQSAEAASQSGDETASSVKPQADKDPQYNGPLSPF